MIGEMDLEEQVEQNIWPWSRDGTGVEEYGGGPEMELE